MAEKVLMFFGGIAVLGYFALGALGIHLNISLSGLVYIAVILFVVGAVLGSLLRMILSIASPHIPIIVGAVLIFFTCGFIFVRLFPLLSALGLECVSVFCFFLAAVIVIMLAQYAN